MNTHDTILDDPDVLAALGDGPDLTDEQTRLLEILLDSKNAPYFWEIDSRAEMLEDFSDFTGTNDNELWQVAYRMQKHLRREGDSSITFAFEFACDRYGVVLRYKVFTSIATKGSGLTVLKHVDNSYHRGFTGLRTALHIAEVLGDNYDRLMSEFHNTTVTQKN